MAAHPPESLHRTVATRVLARPSEQGSVMITSLNFCGENELVASTISGEVFFLSRTLSSCPPFRVDEPVRTASVQSGVLKICTPDTVYDFAKKSLAPLRQYSFLPGNAAAFVSRGGVDYVAGQTGEILRRDARNARRVVEHCMKPPAIVPTTRMAVGAQLVATSGQMNTVMLYDADTLQNPLQLKGADTEPALAVAWNTLNGKLFVRYTNNLVSYDCEKWGESERVAQQNSTASSQNTLHSPAHLVIKDLFGICASGSTIDIFSAGTMDNVHKIQCDKGTQITALALKDTHLAVGTLAGEVLSFELRKLNGEL